MLSVKPNRIGYLVYFAIIGIPLFSYGQLLDHGLLPRQVVLSFILLAVAVLMLAIKDKFSIKASPLLCFAVSALFIAYFAGTLNAHSKIEAIYWLSKIALFLSGFLVFYLMLANGYLSQESLARSFLVFVWASFFLLLNEALGLEAKGVRLLEGKNLYQVQGPFFHKNLFASIMMLSIPFLVRAILFDTGIWRILGWASIGLIPIMLFFLQTKAVILAIMVGAMVVFWHFLQVFRNGLSKNHKTLAWLAALLLIALVPISYYFKEKFVLLFDNETLHERLLVWKNTWLMIKGHPILGVGGGNWQVFFPKYGLGQFSDNNYFVSLGLTTFQRPHNDFLWVWSEAGFLGLLSYLLLFVLSIYFLFGLIRISKAQPREALWYLSLLLVVSGYIVVAFFDFPLERNEHQFVLALLLAIVMANAFKHNLMGGRKVSANTLMVACIFFLGFSLFWSVQRAKGEESAKKVLIAHAGQQWENLLAVAQNMKNPYLELDNFSIPINWYVGVAHFNLGRMAEAEASFRKAYETAPYQVNVMNNLAGMCETLGKRREALDIYNAILAISPSHNEAILNKSAVLFNSGETEEALLNLRGFGYDPYHNDFLYILKGITSGLIRLELAKEADPVRRFKLNALLANEKLCEKAYILSLESNEDFLSVALAGFDQ